MPFGDGQARDRLRVVATGSLVLVYACLPPDYPRCSGPILPGLSNARLADALYQCTPILVFCLVALFFQHANGNVAAAEITGYALLGVPLALFTATAVAVGACSIGSLVAAVTFPAAMVLAALAQHRRITRWEEATAASAITIAFSVGVCVAAAELDGGVCTIVAIAMLGGLAMRWEETTPSSAVAIVFVVGVCVVAGTFEGDIRTVAKAVLLGGLICGTLALEVAVAVWHDAFDEIGRVRHAAEDDAQPVAD